MDFSAMRGAIFDLDGTLLDSMPVWQEVDLLFLKKRGLTLTPDYTKAVKAMNYTQAAVYTKQRYGFADSVEAIVEEWSAMVRDAYAERIQLKPGAENLLRRLYEGGVRISLATASARELFEPALRRNGVYSFFDAFVTVSEVPRGKGFPDIYLRAAEKMDVPPPRCVVFEDILAGVRGARAAGMRVVGVYDEASAGERAKMAQLCDAYIEDFSSFI